jgi:hypothetical protein
MKPHVNLYGGRGAVPCEQKDRYGEANNCFAKARNKR